MKIGFREKLLFYFPVNLATKTFSAINFHYVKLSPPRERSSISARPILSTAWGKLRKLLAIFPPLNRARYTRYESIEWCSRFSSMRLDGEKSMIFSQCLGALKRTVQVSKWLIFFWAISWSLHWIIKVFLYAAFLLAEPFFTTLFSIRFIYEFFMSLEEHQARWIWALQKSIIVESCSPQNYIHVECCVKPEQTSHSIRQNNW